MIGGKIKEMDNKARGLNFGHFVVSSGWKAKYDLYPAMEQQVLLLERCLGEWVSHTTSEWMGGGRA